MNRKQIENYLKNIENFFTKRIFPNRDYFLAFYLDPKSKIEDEIQYTIEISDYDKKISYLFKHFPYPDLIKTIIKKLKFSQFQEQFILPNITRDLNKTLEEHLLLTYMEDLTEMTSKFQEINNIEIDINLLTNSYHMYYGETSISNNYDSNEDSSGESDNEI